MSHTPGPWEVVVFGTYARRKVSIKAHLDYLVASIPTFYPTGERMDLEQRSNATLIAAAPDLLAALEAHYEYRNSGLIGSLSKKAQEMRARIWDLTEAAIAKAKGGTI